MTWVYWRIYCLFKGHLYVRCAVDRTMISTTKTVIMCLYCEKTIPDTHLADLDT